MRTSNFKFDGITDALKEMAKVEEDQKKLDKEFSKLSNKAQTHANAEMRKGASGKDAIARAKKHYNEEKVEEDRMAGKYKKGQLIVQGQWPNPDTWAKEYIIPNADEKGVRVYAKGVSFKIEKL